MRWNIGYIGVKDLFTLFNLLGGVFGIYFAISGRVDYAAYAIFAGFVFGDALDGQVARLTNTGNAFGSEFDAAADHMSQCIAPAVMVFAAYSQAGWEWTGVYLMALLISTGTLRQARSVTAPFEYSLVYPGLPRTSSGLTAMAMPNATLFFKYWDYGLEGGIVVITLVSLLNLMPVPYMTHKGRTLQPYVKILVAMFFLVPASTLIFARQFFFDGIFFFTFCYALTAWIPLRPDERQEFYARYRDWTARLNR